MKKIKILVVPSDRTGVSYYRSTKPHIYLEKHFPEEFKVDIEYQPKFDDEEWLSQYDIVHFHRTFGPYEKIEETMARLKKLNIVGIMDLDDYWSPGQHHPAYLLIKKNNLPEKIVRNMKHADYVTTTTPIFQKEMLKFNENIVVFPNAIDTEEKQYISNPEPSDRIRIGWLGGSSHLRDLEILKGLVGRLKQDGLIDKIQFVLCGYDLRGTITMIDEKSGKETQRKITPMESVWYKYEQIFTDNYQTVSPEYKEFLLKFKKEEFPNVKNEPYRRVWTKPISSYATNYNLFDISLAPLEENIFNKVKCVVGDSLISTNKGLIEIEDIVDNRLPIKTEINGDFNNIINYFKYEDEPTLKIVTKDGYSIEGTHTHRLLINNNWVRLDELKIGDKIQLTKPTFNQNEYQEITYPMLLTKNNENKVTNGDENMLPRIRINEDWGRLLGYLLGDGHLSGKSMVGISFDKRHVDVIDDAMYLFKRIGLNPKLYDKKPDKRCQNNLSKEGFGVDIKLTSKTFINIAKKYGWVGKNGKTFRVPKIILESPKSVIKEFLRGLFEADGTVGETSNVSLTSKDLKLIEQVQTLLLGFGIQSKISHSYNKDYRKYYYRLSLRRRGSEIFMNEIGFISKTKSNKLKIFINGSHSNNEFKFTFEDEIAEIIESVNDVYDIEVENVHSYNANGVINHNSELKVIEAGFHKKALIAQDFGPYQINTINAFEYGGQINPNGNVILIPSIKNHKNWYLSLKKLIENPELISQLANNLYETVKDKYSMEAVTKERAEWYKKIIKK